MNLPTALMTITTQQPAPLFSATESETRAKLPCTSSEKTRSSSSSSSSNDHDNPDGVSSPGRMSKSLSDILEDLIKKH